MRQPEPRHRHQRSIAGTFPRQTSKRGITGNFSLVNTSLESSIFTLAQTHFVCFRPVLGVLRNGGSDIYTNQPGATGMISKKTLNIKEFSQKGGKFEPPSPLVLEDGHVFVFRLPMPLIAYTLLFLMHLLPCFPRILCKKVLLLLINIIDKYYCYCYYMCYIRTCLTSSLPACVDNHKHIIYIICHI